MVVIVRSRGLGPQALAYLHRRWLRTFWAMGRVVAFEYFREEKRRKKMTNARLSGIHTSDTPNPSRRNDLLEPGEDEYL